MIDRKALLADLQAEVVRLESDLREQVEVVDGLKARMQAEHKAATEARRTAATWTTWRDEEVTQAAVAWVLGTVFVRWCEDNELIDPAISGPHWSTPTPVSSSPALNHVPARWIRDQLPGLTAADS